MTIHYILLELLVEIIILVKKEKGNVFSRIKVRNMMDRYITITIFIKRMKIFMHLTKITAAVDFHTLYIIPIKCKVFKI